MREYRGKDIKTGEWVYGYYFKDHKFSRSFILTGDTPLCYIISPNEVDPDTVGQCTGLKDSEGNIIYEGDILDFDETEWGGVFTLEVFTMDELVGEWPYCGSMADLGEWRKVVGNVTDNPELMETS